MYTIPETLDNAECNGWINPDLLLKNTGRHTTNRKRSYELSRVDIDDQCGDGNDRRVLRPRLSPEIDSSAGASRTRPIRSNRTRRQPVNNNHLRSSPLHQSPETTPSINHATSLLEAYDMSIIQALALYNWPQNYLVAHSDPSNIHRLQPPLYSQLGHGLPHFDPWVLHNYLLASSAFTSVSESNRDNLTSSVPQLGYPSTVPDHMLSQNLGWHYPFILNSSFSGLHNQVTRPPELPHHNDSPPDLSYLFRSTQNPHNDASSHATNSRVYHHLPNPFSYGYLCPYHNVNHIVHHNTSSSNLLGNSRSNLTEPTIQQHSFNSYRQPSEVPFGQYWHQVPPALRPVNYPMNSSNIDTLLHLAAHFEQRKRGITRDELDKLPIHRHKILLEKNKKEKNCKDKSDEASDLQKCLVCLEDFESKQSIRTLHCKHEFHAKCIDKWLKINRTCPLCRADAFDGAAQPDEA